jgi:hypothetical protein
MVKPDDLDAGRFDTIAALARDAAEIARRRR